MWNSRMIVFEGPECVGKSTQINLLAEEFSCRTEKRVRTPGRFQMLASIVDDIQQQVLRTSCVHGGEPLVIFDRWQAVSDVVYEKYCYGKTSILENFLPLLGTTCEEANICIVYFKIDKDEMVKRFRKRGDKLRTEEEAIQVWYAYEKFFEDCPLPYITIDVTGKSVKEVNDEIKYIFGLLSREE